MFEQTYTVKNDITGEAIKVEATDFADAKIRAFEVWQQRAIIARVNVKADTARMSIVDIG